MDIRHDSEQEPGSLTARPPAAQGAAVSAPALQPAEGIEAFVPGCIEVLGLVEAIEIEIRQQVVEEILISTEISERPQQIHASLYGTQVAIEHVEPQPDTGPVDARQPPQAA